MDDKGPGGGLGGLGGLGGSHQNQRTSITVYDLRSKIISLYVQLPPGDRVLHCLQDGSKWSIWSTCVCVCLYVCVLSSYVCIVNVYLSIYIYLSISLYLTSNPPPNTHLLHPSIDTVI